MKRVHSDTGPFAIIPVIPDWAHPEWQDWQVTRTGHYWHAAGLRPSGERRALCGVRIAGKTTYSPEEPGSRCGNCLTTLDAAGSTND